MERDGYVIDQVEDPQAYAIEYDRIAARYGLDLPAFYLSVSAHSVGRIHLPRLKWQGSANQYHRWMAQLIRGDLGESAVTGRPLAGTVTRALMWSVALALLAIALVCLVGIPLGLAMHRLELRWLEKVLFFLHSMPVFWLALLLVTFFTTSEYGRWTDILPAPTVWDAQATIWEAMMSSGQRLLIPLLVLVAHDLAFVTQLVKTTADRQSQEPYSLTAKSKGMTTQYVLRRHIFPNALVPIVTMVVGALPRAIAGLLILEVICNIPGMGRLMYDAIITQDQAIVLNVTMLVGVITAIIYLIGDLLYVWLNPKITLS